MKKQTIISMDVDVINLTESLHRIRRLVAQKSGAYICVSNVHMCMETYDSHQFSEIVNNADFVVPDGRPLVWAQKLLGHREAKQVRGQDIMQGICDMSVRENIKIGLYGGSSDSLLDTVINKLQATYPGINITYAYSPPFRVLTEDEKLRVVDEINQAQVDVLFVGIGCPKQEKWMAEHKSVLRCTMLGVGAAFDFISGEKKHAPRFLQKIGLEWFFRLMCEPRRLWKRYLKQNPRFIYYFSKQFLQYKRRI